ncbi:MAG: DUF4271 domain-containing protein [Bacteroidetes bacterium]|nr:DUF4271 domain-containing protein [Bacteroidota bacterium]
MPSPSNHIKAKTFVSTPVDTTTTTSLFENHLLPQKSEQPQLHFTDFDFGIAGILLLAFVLFVWLYATNSKRLNQIVKSFYVSRFSNQLGRDELSLGNRVSVFLSVLFVLTFSLFIYQVGRFYGYIDEPSNVLFFLKLAFIICLVYGVKMLMVRFFGFLFQNQKEAADYSMMIFLFCNILGLFLLPIVICMAFVKDVSPLIFIYSGVSVFALLLLIRVLRGVIIGINSIRVSKFYLFLYLCTLEILPLVIMVKLFIQNVK